MEKPVAPEQIIYMNKPSKPSKYLLIFVIVIFAVVMACLLSAYIIRRGVNTVENKINDSLPFRSSSTDTQKEEKKFDKPKKINTMVSVDKIEWNLIEAKQSKDSLKPNTEDNEYCKPAEDSKYVIITYSIRNVDRPFVTVPKSSVEIYDSTQAKFTSSSKVFKCLLGDDSLGDKYIPDILKKDEKKEYKELYEVPKDSEGIRMKIGDLSITGSEFDYISLGF